MQDMAMAALEGIAKTLPALAAGYFAYRLWVYKSARERADEVIKGALMLRYFSSALEHSLLSDPRGSGLVSIEALNAHLSSVLITKTLSDHFSLATDTYFRWRAVEYFPRDNHNGGDIDVRQIELANCQNACNEVIAVIRSFSPIALTRQNLSSL